MTKFVFLGSYRHEPYDILAVPEKIPGMWNTDEGYEAASQKFYPAMDEADVIVVFAPDGRIGEHTQMDIDYARKIGKQVLKFVELDSIDMKFEDLERLRTRIMAAYLLLDEKQFESEVNKMFLELEEQTVNVE